MASLDDVDLTLKLPRDEEVQRLERAQKRLLALRLQCGGLIGDKKLGPPVLILFPGDLRWRSRPSFTGPGF